jgi:hypothetical protein
MTELNMAHFQELRSRINTRLRDLQTRHADLQINEFPWLFGALGEVPSDVMFICENPSITGVRNAHVDTVDGRLPDIEAQWWGGYNDPAAKRFRPVLRRMGLKTTHSAALGGWKCYITNVVKEANLAGPEQDAKTPRERVEQARAWADILRWEMEQVRPKHVFCVGQDSFRAVQRLQRERLLPAFGAHYVCHYSARGSDEKIIEEMLRPLRDVLGRDHVARPRPKERHATGEPNTPARVPDRSTEVRSEPASQMRSALETKSLEELTAMAWERGVVMPEPVTREALTLALASLPRPVTSRSAYSGKRIVRRKKYQKGGNPRQLGSHGYNAYELIPLGDFGIRFEDLLARIKQLPAKSSKGYGAGGRNHIKWDLDHGHTYLIDDRPVPVEQPAAAGKPRRQYDSSKTRVAPVLDAVSASGPGWVRKLLSLPTGGSPNVPLDPSLRLEAQRTYWGDNERALDPPVGLLSWLIRNLTIPPAIDDNSETAQRRRRLYERDPATIAEALRALRSDSSPKAWHTLEGPTYPDGVIETPDAIVVIEGKRTERGPTNSTKWMPVRHQMLRHLDCAWEIRGHRHVFGFFVVESDDSGQVPDAWRKAADETVAADTIGQSLPHRSPEERAVIVSGFLGVATWAEICSAFEIDSAAMLDRVPAS